MVQLLIIRKPEITSLMFPDSILFSGSVSVPFLSAVLFHKRDILFVRSEHWECYGMQRAAGLSANTDQ